MKKEDIDSMMKIIVYLHKITQSPSTEEFYRGFARALESCQEYLYGSLGIGSEPCDTSWKREFLYGSLDIGSPGIRRQFTSCDVNKK